MCNYHQNFPHFPRHASLPPFSSRIQPNNRQTMQNMHPQLQNDDQYSIQHHTQPIFEPPPDALAIPLEPTVRQLAHNGQAQTQIDDTHNIQDRTQSYFASEQDALIQMETNDQQSLLNMQPQYPILSSNPVESRHQSIFNPLPDMLTSFNSQPQESAQSTWEPTNIQQKVAIPSPTGRQNYNEAFVSPLPDILTPLETLRNQRLTPDILSQPTNSQVVNPTQLLYDQHAPQLIRRTVSKPTIPSKKGSKTKLRRKKTVRDSALSHTKHTQRQLPPSMNSIQQFKEHINNLNAQAPPADLPGVLQNNLFKASLQSVLARSRKPHSTSAPNRTQSTLQPRFPDRAEGRPIFAPKARYPARDHGKSSAMLGTGKDRSSTVEVMSASGLVPQGFLPVNHSTPNLKRPPIQQNSDPLELTIRKRPASCSALPSKKSAKEIAKKARACDSVDLAVAEGRELTKEQLRVLKNRQHAFNSRERTKKKRREYDEENAMLRARIAQLEDENEQLRTMRNTLLETAPEHLRMQVHMIDSQMQENGSNGK